MTGSVAEPGLNTLCIIKSLSYADIDEMDPVPFCFASPMSLNSLFPLNVVSIAKL